MRRAGLTLAAVALRVAASIGLVSSSAQPAGAETVASPKVIVYGDSFSAGEGLPDVDPGEAECQRALGRDKRSTAWGVTVARAWGAEPAWFAACTGAVTANWSDTEQVTNDPRIGRETRRPMTQRLEARAGAPGPAPDAITLSFGGNDIGFSDKIYDCLGVDVGTAGELAKNQVETLIHGGWRSNDYLNGKIARCSSDTDATMRSAIDTLGGKMTGFYNRVANDLAPGGTLVVAGYPQLIATTTSWDPLAVALQRCYGIYTDDASTLNGINARLNEVLAAAVTKAQQIDPKHTYIWIDVTLGEFTPSHSLCSATGYPFLNGLTTGIEGPGLLRLQRSFHPNEKGYAAYAGSVLAKVPRIEKPVSFPDWKNFSFPKGLCGADSGPMVMRAGKTSKATHDNPTLEAPVGSVDDVVEGELTGDKSPEAVVIIGCNRSGVAGGGVSSASVWRATGPATASLVIPDISTAIGAAGGEDSGFVFGAKISSGTLAIEAGATGPGDLSGQPQARQKAVFRLVGDRLEPQGKVKASRGPDGDPVGPFVAGLVHGFDVSDVAAADAVTAGRALKLNGLSPSAKTCGLAGDVTSECVVELSRAGGGTVTIIVAYQPDVPKDVEFRDGQYYRANQLFTPIREIVVGVRPR